MSVSHTAATAALPRSKFAIAHAPVLVLTAIGFAVLFGSAFTSLLSDWWYNPEASHGLIIGPLAVWLGLRRRQWASMPNRTLGIAVLLCAVLLRIVAGMAAEQYTMRLSMIGAAGGLTLFFLGVRQLTAWWLPATLLVLSVPLPELVISRIALPLQFTASELGASLLRARHVPVMLAGNIIRMPGHELFVTEACSGLRSLTALLSLGVLIGGTALRHPLTRAVLLAAAIPIAVLVNGARVFVTGFVVYFVSADAGKGILHATEGWLMFIAAFVVLAAFAWLGARIERVLRVRGRDA
jgi:exosortase